MFNISKLKSTVVIASTTLGLAACGGGGGGGGDLGSTCSATPSTFTQTPCAGSTATDSVTVLKLSSDNGAASASDTITYDGASLATSTASVRDEAYLSGLSYVTGLVGNNDEELLILPATTAPTTTQTYTGKADVKVINPGGDNTAYTGTMVATVKVDVTGATDVDVTLANVSNLQSDSSGSFATATPTGSEALNINNLVLSGVAIQPGGATTSNVSGFGAAAQNGAFNAAQVDAAGSLAGPTAQELGLVAFGDNGSTTYLVKLGAKK